MLVECLATCRSRLGRSRTSVPALAGVDAFLIADGRTLRTGEDRLTDMAYLARGSGLGMNQALAYDLRMLDEWFVKTFAAAAPH